MNLHWNRVATLQKECAPPHLFQCLSFIYCCQADVYTVVRRMYILLSGGLFLLVKVFPEGSGHEGLLELVIDEEISDVGFVQEHDFEVFCAVKVL